MTKEELIILIKDMGYELKSYMIQDGIYYNENICTLNDIKIYFLFLFNTGKLSIQLKDDKLLYRLEKKISVEEFINILKIGSRIEKIKKLKYKTNG